VTVAVIKLALIAALASTEIAWWEGRWADRGVACNAATGDRPMKLSAALLDLGEAECVSIKEQAFGKGQLRLKARCRDHGNPTLRSRSFVLKPSNGGKTMTMTMTDGSAVWHLRKCPRR
jgi:hypothetical protein